MTIKPKILNSGRPRYKLISSGLTGPNTSEDSPNHKYRVVSGIFTPHRGYTEEVTVTYFLRSDEYPEEAKDTCVQFLITAGYVQWLISNGYLISLFARK